MQTDSIRSNVVDLAAYRAQVLARAAVPGGDAADGVATRSSSDWWSRPPGPVLSARQVAHRERMLRYLLQGRGGSDSAR
jgi:hypothetical protein